MSEVTQQLVEGLVEATLCWRASDQGQIQFAEGPTGLTAIREGRRALRPTFAGASRRYVGRDRELRETWSVVLWVNRLRRHRGIRHSRRAGRREVAACPRIPWTARPRIARSCSLEAARRTSQPDAFPRVHRDCANGISVYCGRQMPRAWLRASSTKVYRAIGLHSSEENLALLLNLLGLKGPESGLGRAGWRPHWSAHTRSVADSWWKRAVAGSRRQSWCSRTCNGSIPPPRICWPQSSLSRVRCHFLLFTRVDRNTLRPGPGFSRVTELPIGAALGARFRAYRASAAWR